MRTLNRLNKLSFFSIPIALALIFNGCSLPPDTGKDIDLSALNGAYIGNGYTIDFSFSSGIYSCMDSQGRIGNGECGYKDNELFLVFDDFYYNISVDDDGNLSLRQNGSGNAESLDSIKLKADFSIPHFGYDITTLNGEWSNKNEVTVKIDSATNSCSYSYDKGKGECTLTDDFNGKGPYLYMGYYKAYPIIDIDNNMTFEILFLDEYEEPDDIILIDAFTKKAY